MTDPIDAVTETAKATQEVAKAAGKGIDATREFGAFVARFVGAPLAEGMGIVHDILRYKRWENQTRLMQRANQLCEEAGIKQLRPLPFKLAVPLIEGAALEDEPDLQDMWAKLLVNAANPAKDVEITRSYVAILEQLTPFHATLLKTIYALPFAHIKDNGVWTAFLPGKAIPGGAAVTEEVQRQTPAENLVLALADLKRLGCIQSATAYGGGEMFHRVLPTILGKHFVEACSS